MKKFSGTGDFSIECWFFLPSGLAGGNYTIISNAKFDGIDTYEGGFELTLNTNNNAINFTLNDGSGTWNNSKGTARCFITTGKWYHLVVNRTGNDVSNWTMYLNGVSQTVTVNQNNLTTGDISAGTDENLKIGTRLNGHPSAPGYMNGSIREVRLYNRVLGSTEISDNYNDSCNSLPNDTTGLVLWSKLDKGSGTSETDYSRFAETGTFTGTGLSWGRKIRRGGCTNSSICFNQKTGRFLAGYRFGFQGQEKDDEIGGTGNYINYKFRVHDARLGRFLSIDPLNAKYPHYSPYSFSGNKVIGHRELEGLEERQANVTWDDPGIQKLLNNGTTVQEVKKNYQSVMYGPSIAVDAGLLLGFSFGYFGTSAVIGFFLEETAEAGFEAITGIPVIIDPADVLEKGFRKGLLEGGWGGLETWERKRAAEYLESGSKLKRIKETPNGAKQADWVVDGKITEFKSLQGNKYNASTALGKLQDATKKDGVEVIDLDIRNPGGTKDDARNLYDRFRGTKEGESYKGEVRIATNDGMVTFNKNNE